MPQPGFFWRGGGAAFDQDGNVSHSNKRHNFSLAACAGCHAGETETNFVHVDNRTPGGPGAAALLSGFLTGIDVPDPEGAPVTRHFHDLSRRQRRQRDVESASCAAAPAFDLVTIEKLLQSHKPLPVDLFEGIEQVPLERRVNVPLESFTMPRAWHVH